MASDRIAREIDTFLAGGLAALDSVILAFRSVPKPEDEELTPEMVIAVIESFKKDMKGIESVFKMLGK